MTTTKKYTIPLGGNGSGTTIQLTAGEAIRGAANPKAVFAGTVYSPASENGIQSSGGLANVLWDVYNPGVHGDHSIDWSSKKFAYKLTGGKTFNEITFYCWNNSMTVVITAQFYKTGVTAPTGSPFHTHVINYSEPGGGGVDQNIYNIGEADCTLPLTGGNNYWLVLTFGVGSTTVDLAPHISGAAPDFLEWNGSSYVTPFSSPGRSPGIKLGLVPELGHVYNSLDGDGPTNPSSSQISNWVQGRGRFLGFVSGDYDKGDLVTITTQGELTFLTNLFTTSNQKAIYGLGGLGGIAQGSGLLVGIATALKKLKITRSANGGIQDGIYQ